MASKNHSIIPGFGLTFGFTVLYLSLIVMIPLSALVFKTLGMGWDAFVATVTNERVLNSFRVSFTVSFFAAIVNTVFGVILAWVLVRYRFPGRKVIDAMVDLPFALPTAIAGIALTTLYAPNGWVGKYFAEYGIKVAFTPLGIGVALVFIGIPFVVRTVEPVLLDMDKDTEEAAYILGATRWQAFTKVILPHIMPSTLTGFAMSFARGLGEYGSVIFIAGNMPNISEIVPLLIVVKLEQYDYAGAAAIALVMLMASFTILFAINLLQKWSRQRSQK